MTTKTGPIVFGSPEALEIRVRDLRRQRREALAAEVPAGLALCAECDGEAGTWCVCGECGHEHDAECPACHGEGVTPSRWTQGVNRWVEKCRRHNVDWVQVLRDKGVRR